MATESVPTPNVRDPRPWRRTVVQPNRPSLTPGSFVWCGSAGYVAELVERHDNKWVAGVVAASDARRTVAKMRFIPVHELDWV